MIAQGSVDLTIDRWLSRLGYQLSSCPSGTVHPRDGSLVSIGAADLRIDGPGCVEATR